MSAAASGEQRASGLQKAVMGTTSGLTSGKENSKKSGGCLGRLPQKLGDSDLHSERTSFRNSYTRSSYKGRSRDLWSASSSILQVI